jgi:glycerophosphoryl diester phosphodiesterase
MRAFEHAITLGYRYIETDVQATNDGELLAFHDARLDRVTDQSGAVADLSWDRVRQARVAGSEPIPRFAELLATWPDVRINVDCKQANAVEPLIAAVRAAKATDRICVSGFDHGRLRYLREALGPGLCTSMSPREILQARLASLSGRPIAARHVGCVQVPVRQSGIPIVDRRFIACARRAAIPVHVWTIDDPLEMNRLLDLGVDGLMTDRPTVLRGVLQARAQWG